MAAGGERQAANRDLPERATELEVKERARLNGLELSDAEARDLAPYFVQHQGWLATLRSVVGEREEPATRFRVGDAGDARE